MTTKRTQVPAAVRRRQLADAALRVMARDGARALTTRAVAAEAGVPHGTVHYAFPEGKDALLRAVMTADVDRAADALDPESLGEGSAEEILSRAFASFADRLLDDPDGELALYELALMGARDPELRPALAENSARYREVAEGFLRALAAHSGGAWDGDVTVIAEQVLSLVFGVSQEWLTSRDDALLRAVLADAAVMFAARLR